MGWGVSPWGLSPWGVGETLAGGAQLQLVSVTPVRENVARLQFNGAIYFSRLLDSHDGSSRKRYAVTPVPGSVDADGDPTRPVFPATVAVAPLAGSAGSAIDVTLDRPMSSFPARYSISVNQLKSIGGALLDLTKTSAAFDGLQYDEAGGAARPAVSSGDFANPQTAGGLTVGISIAQAAILGSYPVGPNGDYATDRGIQSYKKRIIRRLLSRKGGFSALSSTYGLGPQERLKKLFRGTDATALGADATSQVLADPETASAKVTFQPQAGNPGIGYFTIVAQHVSGESVRETVPIAFGIGG